MFILYVGNFGPAHSTENHLRQTLEGMGHHVKMAQENRVQGADVARMIESYPVDILLWTRTWAKPGWEPMLRAARSKGIPSVAYHLDLYWTLARESSVWDDLWWQCDFVFTADGGSDERWAAHGVQHYWMPPGVFEREAYLAPGITPRVDVAFVGTAKNYHREWPYRERLVRWLRRQYGPRFRHVGHGGERALRGDALNRFYASVKVVVGDALCPNFRHARYWSDRVPETTGRGGFLIHPYIEGLEQFYEDGREIVYYRYNDWEGLKRLIDYYVTHDDEREQIRRAGHAATLRHSTYRHRMEAMLRILQDSIVFDGTEGNSTPAPGRGRKAVAL